jgi:hypothetical protein
MGNFGVVTFVRFSEGGDWVKSAVRHCRRAEGIVAVYDLAVGPVRMKMPPQILRLILLTLGIVGSYLVARAFLTPVSFGEYGWYRGNALAEVAARTPVYAGKQACEECHSEVLRKFADKQNPHQPLSCEACHGVSREHSINPDVLPVKLTGSHCIRCHEANPSRPKWLKQIVVKEHYGANCPECHVPHQPNQNP